jgi:hypothetical protein
MDPEDVGGAFTGQPAVPAAPRVDPAQASGQWDDWLNRPGNRTALLQMGLQLMQPVGIGQTAGGALAQGIGAGGEAVSRSEEADLKERMAESKLQVADEKLRIAQQQADASTTRAGAAAARAANRNIGGLTDVVRARFAREDARNYERQLDRDAAAIAKKTSGVDAMINPDDPVVKEYKGLTQDQIREKLRAGRPRPKYGAIPSNVDTSDESDGVDTANEPAPVVEEPPYPGAQKAPDGQWYVKDPKNPGKYLRVKQR